MAKLLTALAENGYELEQGETLNDVTYKVNGLLAREQIENFPVHVVEAPGVGQIGTHGRRASVRGAVLVVFAG